MEQINKKISDITSDLQHIVERLSSVEIDLMNDPQDELNDTLTKVHSNISHDIENLEEATEDFQMKINRK